MTIFGIGFRLVIFALALVLERVGGFLRENPFLRRFVSSPPDGLDDAVAAAEDA